MFERRLEWRSNIRRAYDVRRVMVQDPNHPKTFSRFSEWAGPKSQNFSELSKIDSESSAKLFACFRSFEDYSSLHEDPSASLASR